MGVKFFPCAFCGASICDHSHHIYCRDICERKWCNSECAIKEGYRPDVENANDPNDFSCNFCREEDIEDSELLLFLMKEHNWSRVHLVKHYLKNRK